ncbi:MAG TPA: TIGR00282 family metallophosphoesterase [Chloroflexota bacterium]
MRILFIGDIYGKPGRKAVRHFLPKLREQYAPDVVLANGENMAGGAGITRDTAREMFELGIEVLTTGNHVWDQREAIEYLDEEPRILRPLNWPPGTPGHGWINISVDEEDLTVVNLQGRVFMRSLDDPFRGADALLRELQGRRNIFVDFHAEATGEKQALGFYLDGRVSALVGTHTHVPTADARVLPQGTAYITDVGMVGPRDSVIGSDPTPIIERYLTQMYRRLEVARGPVVFNAVVVDLDAGSRATSIRLVQELLSG